MEPIEYLRAIRRRWYVVVLTVALFAGGAWATTAIAEPTAKVDSYQANAILLRSGGSLSLDALTVVVGFRPVAVRAAELVGYEGDPVNLIARVSAESNEDTGLLTITATGQTADSAQGLANAYGTSLIRYIESVFVPRTSPKLASRIAELQEAVATIDERLAVSPPAAIQSTLQQQRLESALLLEHLTETYQQAFEASVGGAGLAVVQPAYQSEPILSDGLGVPTSLPVRIAIGEIVGLAVGIALALVLARFDTRIRTRDAAEEHFKAPVLAEIPVLRRLARKGVVAATDPSSPTAEAFSLLGAELVRLPAVHGEGDGAGPPRTILVTSAGNDEGKSTVVANLAVALSEMGKRVLVVSADFRRPAVHRFFGVPNATGLAQALEDASSNGKPVLEGHVWTTHFSTIWVVPSGAASKRPGELLSSQRMRTALVEARATADVTLLDTAPVLAGSDATHLLSDVDGVLVVARAGATTPELAKRASGLLRRLHAPVLGVALNAAESAAVPGSVRTA
jgi:capsular exopolysaccharide synthesis family protein